MRRTSAPRSAADSRSVVASAITAHRCKAIFSAMSVSNVVVLLGFPLDFQGAGGMKRRLPITIESEFVLVDINLPPHTEATNRHGPNPAHPGRSAAASHAAVIAANAQPSRCGTGRTVAPPNSTATAANATAKRCAR